MHHTVETGRVLQEVVNTGHYTEHTEGEKIDTDDSDNTCLSADEPTEQTEESSDEIDNSDGSGKLPTGDSTPEWTVSTSDEDEPILGEGNFEEEDFVALTKVLNDTMTGNECSGEGDPGTDSENDSENGGDSPEFGEIPFDGSFTERSVIVGNGKSCNIGKDGDKDNQFQLQTGVKNYDP